MALGHKNETSLVSTRTKKIYLKIFAFSKNFCIFAYIYNLTLRVGEGVSRLAHNQETTGANPVLATNKIK